MANEFSAGFNTLGKEIKLDSLPIDGEIPEWLTGTLLRNGPGRFDFGGRRYNTWLDGMAMLCKFSFSQGQVSFANKYIQSNTLRKNTNANKISVAEFATDPCRTIFQRVYSMFFPDFTDNTSVNIANLADKFVAMTETSIPIEIDVESLDTLDHVRFTGVGGQLTTAHPHYDFANKVTYNYTTSMFVVSHYKIFCHTGASAKRELIASIPATKPAYMHSFAMTEHYIVMAEFPLKVCPSRLLVGFSLLDKPFIDNYKWMPEEGTVFHIVRKRDGKVVAKRKADAFFAFHHINAFEQGNSILVDISAFEDARIISQLSLDKLSREQPEALAAGEFRRYHLSLEQPEVTYEVLSDHSIELPRINYRHFNGVPYNNAYGISCRKDVPGDWFNQLVKVDINDKTTLTWFEDHCYPGEPVFIPAPKADSEDDGVVVSVVLNVEDQSTFLLVLDGRSFREVGRATVPMVIPYGFHGQYLPLIQPAS